MVEVTTVEAAEAVLDAQAPIVPQAELDAASHGPAGERIAGAGKEARHRAHRLQGHGRLDIRKSDAARGVDHEAIPCVAETAAERSLPVVLHGKGVARNEESRNQRATAHKSPIEAGALEVAFDAPYPGAGLPVKTNLTAADEGPVGTISAVAKANEAEWRKPNNLVEEYIAILVGPLPADVAADIEPAPVIGHRRRHHRRRRPPPEIGRRGRNCHCGQSHRPDTKCQCSVHDRPPRLASQVQLYFGFWPLHGLVHKKHSSPKRRTASRVGGNRRIA